MPAVAAPHVTVTTIVCGVTLMIVSLNATWLAVSVTVALTFGMPFTAKVVMKDVVHPLVEHVVVPVDGEPAGALHVMV